MASGVVVVGAGAAGCPGKSYRRLVVRPDRGHHSDGSLAIADSICALQTTTRRRPESMMP